MLELRRALRAAPSNRVRRPAIQLLLEDLDTLADDVVPAGRHPMVSAFGALWRRKRRGDDLPRRADFAMEELAPWFGHVIIMDVIDGGRDFRYRLIGTSITGFLDRDYSRRLVSECDYGDDDLSRDKIFDTFRRPIARGGPVFRSGRVLWAADRTWRSYDSVHCPLRRNTGAAELTIGVLYFGAVAVPEPSR